MAGPGQRAKKGHQDLSKLLDDESHISCGALYVFLQKDEDFLQVHNRLVWVCGQRPVQFMQVGRQQLHRLVQVVAHHNSGVDALKHVFYCC